MIEKTPDTQPFWDAVDRQELHVQRCLTCGRHYFYPRPFCRYCFSRAVVWTPVSGAAELVSYVVDRRPLPGRTTASNVIAIVALAEGPTMMTNIVGLADRATRIDQAAVAASLRSNADAPIRLQLGMALHLAFAVVDGQQLPVFSPAEEASA